MREVLWGDRAEDGGGEEVRAEVTTGPVTRLTFARGVGESAEDSGKRAENGRQG